GCAAGRQTMDGERHDRLTKTRLVGIYLMLAGVLAVVLAGLGVGGAGASRTHGHHKHHYTNHHSCHCSTTTYATSTTYPQTTTTPTTPPLPHTGTSPLPLVWFGLVLILTGMGLTVRRPRARV